MKLTHKFLEALQQKLKVGNRNSVHLNAISRTMKYRFDLNRLAHIQPSYPSIFLEELFSKSNFTFPIKIKDSLPNAHPQNLSEITKGLDELCSRAKDIKGEKGINSFGFGYPLLVRKDSDNKIIVAPLLIWNLRIETSKKMDTWFIKKSKDDSVVLNEVLFNQIESELGLKLDTISEGDFENGVLNKEKIHKICNEIILELNRNKVNELQERESKIKVGTCNKIPSKNNIDSIPIDDAEIYWGGLFSIFETQKQSIIKEYDILLKEEEPEITNLNFSNSYFQSLSSIPTDPSQQSILNSLKSKKNIVIHGPPGTGKSQTLTAIIVNALENKKKILVVCEKSTALDVLCENLKSAGLESLLVLIRDSKKGRREVVNKVHEIINNRLSDDVDTFISEELNTHIVRTKELINEVNNFHKNMASSVLGGKNWTATVGDFLKYRDDIHSRPIPLEFNSDLFKYHPSELADINELLEKGESIFFVAKPFLKNCPINHTKFLGNSPYQIEEDLRNDILEYKVSIQGIRKLQNQFLKDARNLISKKYAEDSAFMNQQISLIFDLCNKYLGDKRFMNEQKTNSPLFQFLTYFSEKKRDLVKDQKVCKEEYREVFSFVRTIRNFPINPELIYDSTYFRSQINEMGKALNIWIAKSETLIDEEMERLETNEDAKNLSSFLELQESYGILKDKILNGDWFDESPLYENNIFEFIENLDSEIYRLTSFLENDNTAFGKLHKYFNFIDQLSEKEEKIVEALQNHSGWISVFSFYYLDKALARKHKIGNVLNENIYEKLEQKISKIKNYQPSTILNHWLGEQKKRVRIFDSKSERKVKNLYNKRRSVNHPRKSLRVIIEEDIHLFQSFFPVIFTTPIVASTLFGEYQNAEPFDIVLFDEASQLKIEDTLPALLKGKQKIISGDEHQMPPSKYFKNNNENIIEGEEVTTQEVERKIELGNDLLDSHSLLELGMKMSFDDEYLNFHYRSEHQYLIDFSNKAFYNNRLCPMPSSFEHSPIEFNQMKKGEYKNNTNKKEAQAVLKFLVDLEINEDGKYDSVGIATFNLKQKTLIQKTLSVKAAEDDDFYEKYKILENNGLFVKNLENIQGDERDIIILSTTYGKKKDGRFSQNFGPINQAKGYKLLNVIITRAKKRIIVYTSIPRIRYQGYQKLLAANGNNGIGVLYAYLTYARAISKRNFELKEQVLRDLSAQNKSNISDSFSPMEKISNLTFEKEISEMLLEYYPSQKIKSQYQFAGFKIDIAYISNNKDTKSIAIECDGTKNHLSKEAYLYDLQKKKVLEENGFLFYRIWSTDWWRDYKGELNSLVDFINKNVGIVNQISPPSNAIVLDLSGNEKLENIKQSVKIGDTIQL